MMEQRERDKRIVQEKVDSLTWSQRLAMKGKGGKRLSLTPVPSAPSSEDFQSGSGRTTPVEYRGLDSVSQQGTPVWKAQMASAPVQETRMVPPPVQEARTAPTQMAAAPAQKVQPPQAAEAEPKRMKACAFCRQLGHASKDCSHVLFE